MVVKAMVINFFPIPVIRFKVVPHMVCCLLLVVWLLDVLDLMSTIFIPNIGFFSDGSLLTSLVSPHIECAM